MLLFVFDRFVNSVVAISSMLHWILSRISFLEPQLAESTLGLDKWRIWVWSLTGPVESTWGCTVWLVGFAPFMTVCLRKAEFADNWKRDLSWVTSLRSDCKTVSLVLRVLLLLYPIWWRALTPWTWPDESFDRILERIDLLWSSNWPSVLPDEAAHVWPLKVGNKNLLVVC